ncbi:MAG: isoaspartyl peptidase/L-asparaginase family protein [Pirellulales bacterium]
MSRRWIGTIALWAILPAMTTAADEGPIAGVVLGIHGGIGMKKKDMTADMAAVLRADLERSLRAGHALLAKDGGTALDAVEAAVRVLEDSPEFNAGKGAIFTRAGRNELDASIMEGRSKRAGAVGFVTTIKNPISAARAVMEQSKHVLLVGPGAEQFAASHGQEIVEPAYFRTERRWQQHQKELRAEAAKAGGAISRPRAEAQPWSTVGAVAVDGAGNLAAATSTGGTSNKLFGRLGDSPIIGAGTYADNESCAVSGTGHGEYFIRLAVAYDIGALMKYKGLGVAQAAAEVVQRKLKPAGGDGGVIALDARGNFAAAYNTEGMYRGWITRDGQVIVRLYED